MSQVLAIDLREIVLSNRGFGPSEIDTICHAISEDFTQFALLRDAVNELQDSEDRSPASLTRLGVCLVLIGRFREAEDVLKQGDGGALSQFYLGKIAFQLGNDEEAIAYFDSAAKAGYTVELCQLATAEIKRTMGDLEGSMALLDNIFGPVEQTAEYLYQRGATVACIGENLSETLALYERAVTVDPKHPGALFGLAMQNERAGNDEEAFDLYKRAASVFPAHVGTLINLGLMYEDRNDYSRAQACYKRILDTFPDNPRAKLFAKDAAAGGESLYDEDSAKRNERMAQILSVPVADFELSVRSRNCLAKMGIRTLGDLARTSEQQLLTSKNFGETSLTEIREMLSSRGLSLGQYSHERVDNDPPLDTSSMTPDQQALLDRPISDLNLSVRARKCMVRLQMSTIGELIRRTGDDLLECKNFGVTSLNEVREKLSILNLKLRGD